MPLQYQCQEVSTWRPKQFHSLAYVERVQVTWGYTIKNVAISAEKQSRHKTALTMIIIADHPFRIRSLYVILFFYYFFSPYFYLYYFHVDFFIFFLFRFDQDNK